MRAGQQRVLPRKHRTAHVIVGEGRGADDVAAQAGENSNRDPHVANKAARAAEERVERGDVVQAWGRPRAERAGRDLPGNHAKNERDRGADLREVLSRDEHGPKVPCERPAPQWARVQQHWESGGPSEPGWANRLQAGHEQQPQAPHDDVHPATKRWRQVLPQIRHHARAGVEFEGRRPSPPAPSRRLHQ